MSLALHSEVRDGRHKSERANKTIPKITLPCGEMCTRRRVSRSTPMMERCFERCFIRGTWFMRRSRRLFKYTLFFRTMQYLSNTHTMQRRNGTRCGILRTIHWGEMQGYPFWLSARRVIRHSSEKRVMLWQLVFSSSMTPWPSLTNS